MKLRQLPGDFIVEEINEFKPSKEVKAYKLYTIEKEGIESFKLLKYLSEKNNVPHSEIGIAGLKDKHAITKQYLTIPSRFKIDMPNERNLRINFLGYVDDGLKTGDLIGNRFEITIRDVLKGEIDGVYAKAETLQELGVPNYFDSQRFGSVSENEFMAKHVIKGDYESAVKIYLTKFTKFEKKEIKEVKRSILKNWTSLGEVKIENKIFSNIINAYLESKDWRKAYLKIPAEIREMLVSAYQSFIWNECVKELLKNKIPHKKYLYAITYNAGFLLFYKRAPENMPERFHLIGPGMKLTDIENEIVCKVLKKEELKIEDFDIKEEAKNYFKPQERSVTLKPEDFKIGEKELDELNDRGKNNRFKIVTKFRLPKGSYATVIMKRLCNT